MQNTIHCVIKQSNGKCFKEFSKTYFQHERLRFFIGELKYFLEATLWFKNIGKFSNL